jgi:hypothetical protein
MTRTWAVVAAVVAAAIGLFLATADGDGPRCGAGWTEPGVPRPAPNSPPQPPRG